MKHTALFGMLALIILIASVIGAARPGTSQPAADRPGVTVGILREDAVLIPFATFDGQMWRNTWPAVPDGSAKLEEARRVADAWWNNRSRVAE